LQLRVLGVVAAVWLATLSGTGAAAGAGVGPAAGPRADFDVRESATAQPGARVAAARATLARHLGDGGSVQTAPTSGGIAFLGRSDGFLTGPSGDDPAAVALGYVRAHLDAFGLAEADLSGLRLSGRYRSIDGVTHLTWVQRIRGIDSYDTFLGANVTADGRLVNITGAPAANLDPGTAEPALGSGEALAAARADVGGDPAPPRPSTPSRGPDRETTFSHGDESARLVVFSTGADARLAWRLEVLGADSNLYEVVLDAQSGRLLARHSLTEHANAALVYDLQPDQTASPRTVNLGTDPSWIDRSEGGTKLQGNNVHAHSQLEFTGDETEVAQAGGNWSFPVQFFNHSGCPRFGCTWNNGDYFGTRLTNRAQTTTQAFYYANHFHDHLLAQPIGFDEASRNFEFVNTSGQGLGGDAVEVETGRAPINQAVFQSAPEGSAPLIRLGFNNSPYDVKTSDSAEVVYHEYAHGLTFRLVGGGNSGLTSQQAKALGEGWSDWYAEDLVVGEGHRADAAGPGDLIFAAYVGGFGRTEGVDCSVGASAAACPGAGAAGSGGYTFGDLGKINSATPGEEHANGEIWAQTLWDLRTKVGVETARCLVTGGLRLAPSNTGFLEARDAILQSALVVGVPQANIWEVFAARGMGANASGPFGGLAVSEDFTVPANSPPPPPPSGSCTGAGPSGGGNPSPTNGGGDASPAPAAGSHDSTAAPRAPRKGKAPTKRRTGPSPAEIASELGVDLRAIARTLKRLGIRKLRKRRGLTAKRLYAVVGGRFSLLLIGSATNKRAGRTSGRRVTIARGSRIAQRAGRYSLKLRLTKKGKRRLRHAARLTGTLTLIFRTRGGQTHTRSATVNLRR
jgi:hypothetical protein